MATPQPLDLSLYVTAPRLSVPTAVALGIALLSAAPKPAPAVVRRAAARMRGAVIELQQGWRSQVAASEAGLLTPRQADTRVDRAVRAASMRLEALTLLPAEASPDVELAQQAYPRLFPEGLRILTLPYSQEWAYCDRLLATLDEDETFAAEVERVVGEVVLGELRAAQAAYGEALGITAAKESLEVVMLGGPLEAVRSAIVGYALQIVAMQSDDPSRLPIARKALAPIDALRAAQAVAGRRSEGGVEEPVSPEIEAEGGGAVTPDTPVPVVEEDAATGA